MTSGAGITSIASRPAMLIISRNEHDEILIQHGGEVIRLVVLEIRRDQRAGTHVKLGFEAAEEVVINRKERWERLHPGQPVPKPGRQ